MTSNPREQLNKLLDPKFYLENFTKIKGKTPGLIPFVLNDAQKDLFNSLRVNPRVMILKARQIGFCVDKNTKILSDKLEWIRAEDIAIGQSIVSVDEFPLKIGRGSSRKMRTGIVEKKWIVHDDAIQLMTDDGRELILTPGHRMMSQKKGGDSIIWKKVSDMKIGDVLRYIVKPWKETSLEDAWFGGILDGEGCLRFKKHTGAEVCATQRLGALFDDMKQYAVSTGLNFKLEHDNRPTVEGGKFGNKPCAKIVFNRMDEVFRIIGQTRPKRFVGQHWWEGKDLPGKRSGIGWSKIVSIKYLGKREMIDLQTSEKTFIADGYVSHNSTAVTGYLYHKTITNPGTNTALIGYNSDLTAELLDKVKTIYRTTPKSIQPTIQYNSKYEISFPAIDSKILVLPSSENVGRGYTLHNVLCVSGNTRVIMKNFSTRKVSEVSPGDEIINGNGGFSVVSKAIKSQNNKKLLRIISYGSDDLVVTEDHKIMTREKFTGRPIWKKAGELTKNDYLAYPYFQNRNKPVPLVVTDLKCGRRSIKIVDREIPITPEFGLFLGWYLAEGTSGKNRISLSVHRDEVAEVLSVAEVVKPYIGKVSVAYRQDTDSAVITLHGKEFAVVIGNLLGYRAEEKCIPQIAWRWGWDVGFSILRGLIDGDGYVKNVRKVQITTISPRLAVSAKRMMVSLRLGLPAFYENDEVSRYGVKSRTRYDIVLMGKGNYKLRKKLGYTLPVYDNGRARWRIENAPWVNQGGGYWLRGKNYYWSRISSVQEAPNEEYVYDLSLSGDPHSFLTHAGVVSNCTELAFWDKAEEKMLAIENAVPQNGSIVIESTPNAIGNLYHRMWMADNGYDKKKYGWWWHYTEAEIDIIRKRINNPMRFAQEYELEFLSTGRPVFPTDLVKKCRKKILHVGDKVRDENKTEYTVTKDEDGFIMYFPPRPGRIYAVGADVAEGVTGGDLSVAVVWDRATGEEVGFWRGYLPPDRFGMKLNKWGRLYNNALMVVEINNHGLTTVTALKNLLYPQMYFRQANYDSMGTSWSDRLGWRTTKITRPLMIDDFRDALQEGSITIHSESTLDEMLTFVFDDGGNMVAQNSFHDDCIFACAIGFQGFKVLYGSKLEQISYEDYLPTSTPY